MEDLIELGWRGAGVGSLHVKRNDSSNAKNY